MKHHTDLISALAVSKDPRACRGLVLPAPFITGAPLNEREGREGGREGDEEGKKEGRSCIGILHTSRDVKQEADNRQGEKREREKTRRG